MTTPVLNSDQIENLGHVQTLGVRLPNNAKGAVDSEMTHYEETSLASVTYSGGMTSGTFTLFRIWRRDKQVWIHISGNSATAGVATVCTTGVALPARFRPTTTKQGSCSIMNNALPAGGLFTVDTNGIIVFGVVGASNAPAAFTVTQNASVPAQTLVYDLN